MKFNDPHRPSYEEIVEWAYDTDSVEPEQDWDIIVNWLIYPDLILKLASDDSCPSQGYFRHILYVVVGQSVRGNFSTREKHEIEMLFDHAKSFNHTDIQKWKERSEDVIKNPENFVYDDWFAGKLAQYNFS